ncbi:conserved hypothetical protein [Clostridiaceae bacterium BL-3]|nr:conserved hypothetical protein [Clostridiaceae bacterium BL-3]
MKWGKIYNTMIEFEKLDKSEIRLMIEFFLPITPGLIEFLKKKRKLFGNELDGADLKVNSLVLQKRIPNVFSNEIKRKNSVVINFVEKNVGGNLNEINQYIKLKFGSMQNIEKTIQSNREENYIKLLDILLGKMESKYIEKSLEWISLFLNLNGIYINEQQQEMIGNSIEKVVELRKIEKRVLKEEEKLQIKYEKELKAVENKFKNENQILSSQVLEKERVIEDINQMLNEKNKYIDEQQKNYDYLKEKSEFLESKISEMKKELNDNKEKWQQNIIKENQKNQKLESINEDQNKKIEYLENELNRQYKDYSNEYRVRWEKENQLVIDKKIYEKNSLEEDVRKLKKEVADLKKEIINLNDEKEESQKRLKEYNGMVSGFINNIDKELIRSALESSVLNIEKLQTKENKMELYIKHQIKCNNMELLDGIDEEEWSNTILDNLKNIGAVGDRYEWSDYIIGVLAARMIPLIVGYRTREIAKAISCSYAGETPYIITLSLGYNKVNELIELYHNSKAKVILIENAIGQMNESLLLPLFKEYIESKEDNKIILLSCEDINIVHLMPSYLFEYLALIKISDIRPVVQSDYNYADNTKILQSIRKSKLNIEDSYKKLRRLLEYIKAEDSYIITRSLILAYLCNMEDTGSALKCLSICDLKLMFKDDVIEKIGSNIDNYPDYFTQELKKSIIGD